VLADLVDRWDPYVPALFQRHLVTLGGYVILIGLGVIRFSSTVTELVA
jgi:hypothetical protein